MSPPHIVFPTAPHTHTLIFLHGRDSTATDFSSELFESQATDLRTLPETFPGIRWVFPSAGRRESARFGIAMSQWFDMWSLEDPSEREAEQKAELAESVDAILRIVEEEAKIVGGAERVVLAGISQGCATAVHTLLQGCQVGGFVGLAGWLPLRAEVEAAARSEELRTPVLLAHCKNDEVIAMRNGEELRDSLRALGMEVEWRVYEDGGHWLNEPQGVDDIVAFLGKVF